MKFNPRIQFALAVIATVLLTSCGGGGAKNNPNAGGTLALLPAGPTFYAGVVYTMTISGGRGPYALTSDQPQVMSVPAIVNGNTFDVVPNNPGVIDTGLPPGSLPVRTVNITVKDSAGQGPATASVKVGQNFLTSYVLSFTNTTCTVPAGGATTAIFPCAGGDTVMQVDAIIAGNKVGDALFQFDVVTGTMGFINPIGSNTTTQTFQATSDHQGIATGIVRVPSSAPTQIGAIRVTHVASGVSTLYTFVISAAVASPLSVAPTSFSFVGASGQCGNGSGDFFVSGGVPPYKAQSSDPTVSVVAKDAAAGHFTLTYSNPSPPCISGATIVITDSGNSTPVTVTVTSTAGAAVAPTPLSVSPTTLTLACGSTGSVTVVGGSGSYSATASNPELTTSVSGHTVGVTLAAAYPAGSFPGTQTVSITDGSSTSSVTVTAPASCP